MRYSARRTGAAAVLLAALGCRDAATITTSNAELLAMRGDVHAGAGEFDQAVQSYRAAWQAMAAAGSIRKDEAALLVALSLLDVTVHRGDFRAARGIVDEITTAFDSRLYVGNPLYHLRAGQSHFERGDADGRRQAGDDLTRALLGGGVELFDGEDQRYLAFAAKLLEPPDAYPHWPATRGSGGPARHRLNHATGYLADVLTKKFGRRPPYPK